VKRHENEPGNLPGQEGEKKMRLTKLLPAASAVTFVIAAIVTLTVGLPATATPAIAQTATIKLGGKVPMLDSGQVLSPVGVPVSITCSFPQPTQFNLFVTQSPNVTGSFGSIIAKCSGKAENFVVAVQPNFGMLYHEGPAVASANCFFPCVATASRDVTMFRLVHAFE